MPTILKLVFFFILVVVFSFIPLIPVYCIYKCPGCFGVENTGLIGAIFGDCKSVSTTYLIVIGQIILSYIIACFVATLIRRK